ncbi:MAG: hypothetical protein JWR22_2856 [Herminiimonas sp.]|nr:hypothetical protein [Herminiimonas sp.]
MQTQHPDEHQGVIYKRLLAVYADEIAAAQALVRKPPTLSQIAAPYRAPSWHYQENAAGQSVVPLCHAKSSDGSSWARGYYTQDPARVTCKRCLRRQAKALNAPTRKTE